MTQFKIERNVPKVFTPVTVTITLESMDALIGLARRLNLNLGPVERESPDYYAGRGAWPDKSALWNALDELIKEIERETK
jgi:hypothetical protein